MLVFVNNEWLRGDQSAALAWQLGCLLPQSSRFEVTPMVTASSCQRLPRFIRTERPGDGNRRRAGANNRDISGQPGGPLWSFPATAACWFHCSLCFCLPGSQHHAHGVSFWPCLFLDMTWKCLSDSWALQAHWGAGIPEWKLSCLSSSCWNACLTLSKVSSMATSVLATAVRAVEEASPLWSSRPAGITDL